MYNVSITGRAYDGKSAVAVYQKTKPDIVFLDVMMPQYDGVYALERIRKDNPKAKIVMVTADLRKETEQRLEKLKPNSVIFKPFDFGKVADAIDDIRKKGFN